MQKLLKDTSKEKSIRKNSSNDLFPKKCFAILDFKTGLSKIKFVFIITSPNLNRPWWSSGLSCQQYSNTVAVLKTLVGILLRVITVFCHDVSCFIGCFIMFILLLGVLLDTPIKTYCYTIAFTTSLATIQRFYSFCRHCK